MNGWLAMVFMGWPAVITSLCISLIGIIKKRPALPVAGAVIYLPHAWYLSMTPRFRFFAVFLLLFLVGTAYAVQRCKTWQAALFFLPLFVFSGWLGMEVLENNTQMGYVQFHNEKQLEENGFVSRLNKEIDLVGEKVLIEKVVFDFNSMTFVYKSKNPLPRGSIKIVDNVKERTVVNIFNNSSDNPIGPGLKVKPGGNHHTVTIPHNLKLVRQHVPVKISVGVEKSFIVDFPGDKIAAATAEEMFDSDGRKVDDPAEASIQVTVAVNYILIKSINDKDYIVLDKVNKKLLRKYESVYTSGSKNTAREIFEPLKLPRENIKIKLIPEERLVLLSH